MIDVPLNAAVGPAILLAPLAAAVVAKMDSLVTAFAVSVALGVAESVVRLDVSKQSVETPLFLAVILIALLFQRRSESRAEASDESSWSAVGAPRPIPAFMRALPEVRMAKTPDDARPAALRTRPETKMAEAGLATGREARRPLRPMKRDGRRWRANVKPSPKLSGLDREFRRRAG